MADSVKGNHYLYFEKEIQKGVLLHRFIDSFTDFHPTYRKSKHRLHAKYGHYSGVIMDIFYDHFLAKNWTNYSTSSLSTYTQNFYNLATLHFDKLTEKTQKIIPYMIRSNWLESYATIEGIETILFQMDYRTKYKGNMVQAVHELRLFYDEFEDEFFVFFEELIKMCQFKHKELNELL